jgi:hypothetical protein
MIEGSGSGAGSRSGSIPLTSGSGFGSGRPKNTWIRWIRIRNTGYIKTFVLLHLPAHPPPPTLSISVGVLYQMDRGPSISGIERRLQYIRICFIFCSKLHPGYCQGKREDACYAATGVFNLHVRIRFEF